MNKLIKMGGVATIGNAAATIAKLGIAHKTSILSEFWSAKMDTLKMFGTSFVISSVPALLTHFTPDFFGNEAAHSAVELVESGVLTYALKSTMTASNTLNLGMPEFEGIKNFSNNFLSLDFAVDTVNTFAQAKAFDYFSQDTGSELSEFGGQDLELAA